MFVSLGPHIKGRVHLSVVLDELPADEQAAAAPVLDRFQIDQLLEGKVLEVCQACQQTRSCLSSYAQFSVT